MWDLTAWEALGRGFLLFLPRLGLGLLILVVFWVLATTTQRLVNRLAKARHMDSAIVQFLSGATRLSLLFIGLVTALGTLGMDVTALVASLGLTGFALGFAMKDIISNALSGILVLFFRPFRQGDRISVTSLEGTVLEINLRYTVLEAEGQWIYIPNANLITNPVTVKKRTETPLPPEGIKDHL